MPHGSVQAPESATYREIARKGKLVLLDELIASIDLHAFTTRDGYEAARVIKADLKRRRGETLES